MVALRLLGKLRALMTDLEVELFTITSRLLHPSDMTPLYPHIPSIPIRAGRSLHCMNIIEAKNEERCCPVQLHYEETDIDQGNRQPPPERHSLPSNTRLTNTFTNTYIPSPEPWRRKGAELDDFESSMLLRQSPPSCVTRRLAFSLVSFSCLPHAFSHVQTSQVIPPLSVSICLGEERRTLCSVSLPTGETQRKQRGGNPNRLRDW